MRGVRLRTLILLPAWLGLSLAWLAAAAEPVEYVKDVKAPRAELAREFQNLPRRLSEGKVVRDLA
jgi:hypothetical protein